MKEESKVGATATRKYDIPVKGTEKS